MPQVLATATADRTEVKHAGSAAGVDVVPATLVQRALSAPHPGITLSTATPAPTLPSTVPTHVARESNVNRLPTVLTLPPRYHRRTSAPTLHPVQEWEGYVVEISRTHFTARLADLSAGSVHEEEEAIIPLAELSDNDVGKVRIGSIFRWVIGYERARGTKKRVSQIVFRDLPAMTHSDLREGRIWARDVVRALKL